MGTQQEETTQLYSSEDLLAFKPPFKKYSREAVLHFLVHELKCISIDEDYAVTIDMDLFPTNEKRDGFYRVRRLNDLIHCLEIYGYTIFENTGSIAEYIQQYQLDSGFYYDSQEEVSIFNSVICMTLLHKVGLDIPNKDKIVDFIHSVEALEPQKEYPAILDIQFPEADNPAITYTSGAAILNGLSVILHLCNSEWKDIEEKFEWIESTWKDEIGYRLMNIKKNGVGEMQQRLPEQSTIVAAHLYREYNKSIPESRQQEMLTIFSRHDQISFMEQVSLLHSLDLSIPKELQQQYEQHMMKQWFANTGGFTAKGVSIQLSGSKKEKKPTLANTISKSINIEKYLRF